MHRVNQFCFCQGLRWARNAICVVATALVLNSLGCGPPVPVLKNPVKGKVTVDGKGLVANVIFVGADNKELSPALSSKDGDYQIDLPPGDYKVAVRSMMGAVSVPTTTGGAAGGGAAGGGAAGGAAMPGMAGMSAAGPPAIYSSVETSGLTFKHAGGKQTYDIPLKSS